MHWMQMLLKRWGGLLEWLPGSCDPPGMWPSLSQVTAPALLTSHDAFTLNKGQPWPERELSRGPQRWLRPGRRPCGHWRPSLRQHIGGSPCLWECPPCACWAPPPPLLVLRHCSAEGGLAQSGRCGRPYGTQELRPEAAPERRGGRRGCHLRGRNAGGSLACCLWSVCPGLPLPRRIDHPAPPGSPLTPPGQGSQSCERGECALTGGWASSDSHLRPSSSSRRSVSVPTSHREIACPHTREKTLPCSHQPSPPSSSYWGTPSWGCDFKTTMGKNFKNHLCSQRQRKLSKIRQRTSQILKI